MPEVLSAQVGAGLATTAAEHGYPLFENHLGLAISTAASAERSDVDELVQGLAAAVSASGQPFVLRSGESHTWAWIPVGRSTADDVASIGATAHLPDRPLLAGVGSVGSGLSGFRQTHDDARAALRVATLGATPRVVSFHDSTVRAAALLAHDLPMARRLVRESLGDLADDTDGAARLRDTVLAFLQERESYVATAARLHMHRNTVKYRIDRAVAARGAPLTERRLELELALVAATWLAPQVIGRGAVVPVHPAAL